MNIIVIDAEALPQDVDFPPLNLNKYGWQQYLALEGEDLIERCWRADIVISLKTDITAEALNGWHKVALLVVPEDGSVNIDDAAMREEISVAKIAGDFSSSVNAERYCEQTVTAIHEFLDRTLQ